MSFLYLLEAEYFCHKGGWSVDSQFVDQMGSAFLIADGMLKPVRSARHTLVLPDCSVTVWVRTRDWCPDYHPGAFHIEVNGSAGEQLGTDGISEWHWQKAGRWQVNQETQISLIDETGAYARADALLFAEDPQFIPGNSLEETTILRETLTKRSVHEYEGDVLIVGGGLAGCTAAVAAAREGAHVLLVNDRSMLGGNASLEILVPPCGHWNADEPGTDKTAVVSNLNARETGIVEEYRTTGYQKIREGVLYTGRLESMIAAEPNIEMISNVHINGSVVENSRILQANGIDLSDGSSVIFKARQYIDASGDSQFAVSTGAKWRQGREAACEFNEPWGAETANSNTMGNGIKFLVMETCEEQPFQAPLWAYRFENCSDIPDSRHPNAYGALGCEEMEDSLEAMSHQWQLELGGDRNAFEDAESIRDELLRLAYGLWDHVKNHCPTEKERARKMMLRWMGIVAGKRETRRLEGAYMLTQNDIVSDTPLYDSVAYGAWVVDDHYSDGFFHRGTPGHHYDNFEYAAYGKIFGIPYRCLYSNNIHNLSMAGRNISATHLALSNTRVMLTCALTGHAAGTAVGMCIRKNIDPAALASGYIADLQDRLQHESMYIPGRPYIYPGNLLQQAHITASSEMEGQEACHILDGVSRAVGELTHSWHPAEDDEKPELYFQWDSPVLFNFVEITFETRDLAPENVEISAFRDKGIVYSSANEGKKTRREAFIVDSPLQADSLIVRMGSSSGICMIEVSLLEEQEIAWRRRAVRNMKRQDPIPVLPWEHEKH